MEIAFLVFGFLLVAANAVVSFQLSRSTSYDSTQKIGQIMMVWLIPVIGASLVWYFLHDQKVKRQTIDLADRIGDGNSGGGYERMETDSAVGDGGGADGGGD